jgi:zinc finger protein 362/384
MQFLQAQAPQMTTPTATLNPTQTYITLPITIPPSKPGDATQTFQIQVLNPNPVPQPKFQIPIGLQQHGTTVLTVAYSPQDGEILPNQMPDGAPVTVLAAIQPQDLQLLAQQNGIAAQQHLHALHQQQLQHQQQQQQQHQQQQQQQHQQQQCSDSDENEKEKRTISIKTEPSFWTQSPVTIQANPITSDLSEFFHARSINMQPYLKFNTEGINIKKEISYNDAVTQLQLTDNNNVLSINNNYNADNSNTNQTAETNDQSGNLENSRIVENGEESEKPEIDVNGKVKKRRKVKKKPPKPKRPKPGQVHIATAIDGTILFCCPECQMAYPEKESLEQHLAVHKIERRFVATACGS